MRADFAKQLTERERAGHDKHYGEYRNRKPVKGLVDNEVGGREPMKRRYGYDTKSFNENLNPLKGWVRSCLGKVWDKCYGELRTNFDARSVINDHILQHLYDFICVKTKIVDGEIYGISSSRWMNKYEPIKDSMFEFFVHPTTGIVVKNKHLVTYNQRARERAAKKKQDELKVFRVLSDDVHLRLIDGVWYEFEVRDLPEFKYELRKPFAVDKFRVHGYDDKSARYKTWDELNEAERERFGTRVPVSGDMFDVFEKKRVHRIIPTSGYQSRRHHGVYSYGQPTLGSTRYYATKKTAPHKSLKTAGLA